MSLRVDSISKSFPLPSSLTDTLLRRRRFFHALKNVSFEVDEGEFFVILGPTGCGKTTLLNVIAGLIKQDEGRVFLNGECIDHLPPEKRNIGMVFQDFSLFPHMTVAENVSYGLRARGIKGDEARRRVKRVMDALNLRGLEGRMPSSLSGGEKQRVSLARALVVEPSVLLLDEPLSNLDAQTRNTARSELLRVQKELGVTMVYVTHDQMDARLLADKVAVMRNGTIEQLGEVREVFEKPKTSFVAAFMNLGNILSGHVESLNPEGGVTKVNVNGVLISAPYRRDLSIGKQVNLLVKPEDVILATSKPMTSARNVLEATIVNLSFQGPLVRVTASAGPIQVDAMATRASVEELRLDLGQKVYLAFKASAVHILD
ncbi:MAG: ABC transporter ATP-binding protein [Candidatus Freyarchaeota archaeon]|nr:ABC transporter ATP-binding protein [Candidatus Freyrarchaeum guaymaensis]